MIGRNIYNMGRGTPTNIFRRIAKNYLKRVMPEECLELTEVNEALIKCWRNKGQNDLECVRLEEKLSQLTVENKKYLKAMREMRLLQQVTAVIKPPQYQRDKKGPIQFAPERGPWYPFEFKE